MNNFGKFKLFHACTILLALTFLCIKSYEYHDKFITTKSAERWQIVDGHVNKSDDHGRFVDGHLLKQDADNVVIHGHIVNRRRAANDPRLQDAQIKHEEITIKRVGHQEHGELRAVAQHLHWRFISR